MANKRDSNSQKRSRANRAQREALKARTTAASTPRPSRAAPAPSKRAKDAKGPVRSTPADEATSATGSGRRPRRVRPPKPGDTPVDVDSLEGPFLRRLSQVPGGSEATKGGLFTLLAAVFTIGSNLLVHTVDESGRKSTDDAFVANQTLFEANAAVALVPSLLMAVVAVLALRASLGPNRRRAWVLAAFVAGLMVAVFAQILFLLSAGMFVWAHMRAVKVEGPQPLFFRGRNRARDEADEADGAVETTGAEAAED